MYSSELAKASVALHTSYQRVKLPTWMFYDWLQLPRCWSVKFLKT